MFENFSDMDGQEGAGEDVENLRRAGYGPFAVLERLWNDKKWVSRDRVENPRPKEDAPAGAPAVNAAA